jgi:hypothetical protein
MAGIDVSHHVGVILETISAANGKLERIVAFTS